MDQGSKQFAQQRGLALFASKWLSFSIDRCRIEIKSAEISLSSGHILTINLDVYLFGSRIYAQMSFCTLRAELEKYVSTLDTKQEKLFNDYFSRYTWTKIRRKLGLEDYTFHDLRKTFCSVLAQNGVSTVVTQKLLEHSSPDLTNRVYTNVDPVLRHAVDQIPASDWL